MKSDKKMWCFLGMLFVFSTLFAQDPLPAFPVKGAKMNRIKQINELRMLSDTISVQNYFPLNFQGVTRNEIIDTLGTLSAIFERLRLLHAGMSEDTLRVLHVGDSHVRGHIYPQVVGKKLTEVFGAVHYTDMGANGATCLTFTHPDRIAAMVASKPDLLILSFGTNESHNLRYHPNTHYQQIAELFTLIRDSLPNLPILLTTPPGSYQSFRQRRRRATYAVNPRTVTATNTILRFAQDHRLAVWDMYNVVGGNLHACKNWQAVGLMRPDHVHFSPEGYTLQGNLLYMAIIKAYNDYVSY